MRGIMDIVVDQPLPKPTFDPERLDRVFALVAGQVERGELPAAVLAVAGPDGTIRSEAFGTEADRRIGVGFRFPIASITKPVVATAVVQLIEDGRLTLREPIRTIVPEYDPPSSPAGGPGGEAVTLWHLLTHTSGSGDFVPGPADLPDAAAMMRALCTTPLAFAPGTAYRYASDTFLLLGEILKRVGGHASVADALRERIFDPLGMVATGFAPGEQAGSPSVAPHLAGVPDDLAVVIAERSAAIEHPGGGLWSTVGDLVRFGRAMLHGGTLEGTRVIGRAWLDVMTREQTVGILEAGTPPRRPGYGLGWATPAATGAWPGGPAQFAHRGASGSCLWVDRGHGLVIVLLGDLWGAPERLQDAVIGAVYGALA